MDTTAAARMRRYRQRLRERTLYRPDAQRVRDIAAELASRGFADGRENAARIVRAVVARLESRSDPVAR